MTDYSIKQKKERKDMLTFSLNLGCLHSHRMNNVGKW